MENAMSKGDEVLISFVKRVFELSAIPTAMDDFDLDSDDIFDLDDLVNKFGDDVDENLSKADDETLAKQAVEISKEVGINDIWKFAVIFNSFYEYADFAEDAMVEISGNVSRLAPSWQDAVTLLSEGLKERSASPGFTWNGCSEEQGNDVEEFATGCFFLGITAAINIQFDDSDDAAEGIDAWVLGYGNCGDYGDPVGDIIVSLPGEEYWYNSFITDNWIKLLLSLHETDVEEFHTDDGTNWEDAAEDLKMNTL
jgi:hypothetical protein